MSAIRYGVTMIYGFLGILEIGAPYHRTLTILFTQPFVDITKIFVLSISELPIGG